jgi:LruC domain-containing protein
MKTKNLQIYGFLILIFATFSIFISSCKQDNPTDTPTQEKLMDELVIPENFNFETSKQVTIYFQDQLKAGSMARYDVFYHSTQVFDDTITYLNDEGVEVTEIIPRYDETNDLIARKISETGFFNLIVNVPSYITELYVIKNELGVFTSSIIQVNGKSASFKSGLKSGDVITEMLYGVNNSGNIFTIDPLTGAITMLNDLPVGSRACAIDSKNRVLYFVGKNPKYPLYKLDLTTQATQLIANLNMKVDRLDYNPANGLLYTCYVNKIYTIDPQNGKILTQKRLEDMEGNEFGDVKIAPDGKWYLATYFGVYWLEFKTEKVYAHKVTLQNLPFKITGMTITSNGEMWLTTQSNNSQLVKMNKANGSWEYKYSQFNIGIDDLATLTTDEEPPVILDADNDGVPDIYDEYPTDPLRAYNTYTPSVLGLGTLTFEDMWPSKGDYDFNDLMLNYQFKTVMNADDKVVELFGKFTVSHIGGTYKNGFGFQLPFSSGMISSVTGYSITSNLVTLDAKGMEAGQDKAVVIVFDNAEDNIYSTLNIHIQFQNPIDPLLVGTPPFNPFIFINEDRGRELHLINMAPTSKMNSTFFGTMDDRSIPSEGKYYLTSNKLPWTLNLLENFNYPKEKKSINKAYKNFNNWAESGGSTYSDWYKNNPGYRDAAFLTSN